MYICNITNAKRTAYKRACYKAQSCMGPATVLKKWQIMQLNSVDFRLKMYLNLRKLHISLNASNFHFFARSVAPPVLFRIGHFYRIKGTGKWTICNKTRQLPRRTREIYLVYISMYILGEKYFLSCNYEA